jgi:hypothetical protein
LLPWFAAFVDGAARATLRLATVVRSIDRKVRWIARTVAPSLALVAKYQGGTDPSLVLVRGRAYVNELLRDGEERLTAAALALLPSVYERGRVSGPDLSRRYVFAGVEL